MLVLPSESGWGSSFDSFLCFPKKKLRAVISALWTEQYFAAKTTALLACALKATSSDVPPAYLVPSYPRHPQKMHTCESCSCDKKKVQAPCQANQTELVSSQRNSTSIKRISGSTSTNVLLLPMSVHLSPSCQRCSHLRHAS
eukprot:1157758-Pelagomonas_calceolata.AAC.1